MNEMATADPRGLRLTLRRATPSTTPPAPTPSSPSSTSSSTTPASWRPARDVDGLRAQVIDLLEMPPEMLLGPVTPLAIGAGAALAGMAREGKRLKVRKWVRAWVNIAEYLHALAAPGAMRHDRCGIPVEPVEPDDQAHARWRGAAASCAQAAIPVPPPDDCAQPSAGTRTAAGITGCWPRKRPSLRGDLREKRPGYRFPIGTCSRECRGR